MYFDKPFQQRVWDQKLQLIINLSPKDHDKNLVPKLYLKVNRNGYLPFYFDQITEFFQYYHDPIHYRDLWFEFENKAVKWNYPVGLLFDYYNHHNLRDSNWELILHVKDYPNNLIPINEKSVELYWLNQIKESCFIQNNSNFKKIMKLSIKDSKSFLKESKSLNLTKFDEFFFQKLNLIEDIIRIPLKIYLNNNNNNDFMIMVQEPIEPFNNNKSITIDETLEKCLSELTVPKELDLTVLIHGIKIPKDAKLLEVYKYFISVDGFLHMMIDLN